jgi:hypothetical protein
MSIAYNSHTNAQTSFMGSFVIYEIWPGGIYWWIHTFRGCLFPDLLVRVLMGLTEATQHFKFNRVKNHKLCHIRSPG